MTKNGNDCGCKIYFVLSGENMLVLNASENPKIKHLLKEMDASKIDEIRPMFDGEAEKFFGTFGKCGALLMTTSDIKLKRLIKKSSPFWR